MLQIGDLAPEFSATDHTGKTISLADFKGKQALVLFFYPKDFTAGCTAQSCSFRDSYADFKTFNAQVVGVSADGSSSHQKFAGEYRLPYPLLSDEDGSLRKMFGVKKTLGIVPERVTYVVDKNGVVRHVFSALLDATKHVDESLDVVKKLSTH